MITFKSVGISADRTVKEREEINLLLYLPMQHIQQVLFYVPITVGSSVMIMIKSLLPMRIVERVAN